MPDIYDLKPGDNLHRAVFEYDYQPTKRVPNPNYNPNAVGSGQTAHRDWWRQTISVDDGPVVKKEMMIGPYKTTTPIKAWMTRNRDRHVNLRLIRVERVATWEEVQL